MATPATRVSPVTTGNWICGAMTSPAAAAPIAAPTRFPRLTKAWKEDMIGRAYPVSTATAWAFMAVSVSPMPNPTRIMAPRNVGKFGA